MSFTNEYVKLFAKRISEDLNLPVDFFSNDRFTMIVIDSKTGNIVDVNSRALEYYGYSKSEFLKLNIDDISISSEQEMHNEIQLAKNQKRNFFNFKHKLADGDIREVEVYNTFVQIEKKQYLYSLIFDASLNRTDNTFFYQVFLNSNLATLVLNNDNKVIDCNKSFLELFQLEKEDIINRDPKYIVSNNAQLQRDINKALYEVNKGVIITKEGKNEINQGTISDLNLSFYPVLSHGIQIGKMITFTDISEKKGIQNELIFVEKAMAQMAEGIMITDKNGTIEWVNDAFTKITGYAKNEAIGENPRILKSNIHDKKFYENMWKAILKKDEWKGELYNKNKNGNIFIEYLNITSIRDDDKNISNFIAILSDITQNKKRDKLINELAYKDTLTGLNNRWSFVNKLKKEIDNGNTNFAVIYLDIDDFKNVNDTLGNFSGDIVLKEIAKRLISTIENKGVVSRIGGDEFTIIINKQLDREQLEYIGRAIIKNTSEPIKIDNHNIYVNLSIAISKVENNKEDVEVLMKNLNLAINKAKENKGNGENRIVFYDSYMGKNFSEDFTLSNQLVNALERGEFYLVYQPIIDMNTYAMIGVEALIRWKHPVLGNISPSKFIPLAEKTGDINKIGAWVLKTACMQNKEWQLKGRKPIFTSVNISVIQLRQSNFSQIIRNILDETKLEAKFLELEVAETISGINMDYLRKILRHIRSFGVNITIDYFGVGYSSISALNNMYVSKLKIDKSFLDHLNEDNNKKIIMTIVDIAKSLDIEVGALGIETEEQFKFLSDINCDFGQGYYFSKPTISNLIKEELSKSK
ncbi:EAL domain-containing protein [Clostridium sp. DL1XJH146]